jgi:hypothetical protein
MITSGNHEPQLRASLPLKKGEKIRKGGQEAPASVSRDVVVAGTNAEIAREIPGVLPAKRDAVAQVRKLTSIDALSILGDPDAFEKTLSAADKACVEAYVEDMRAGRWMLNGQPIVVEAVDIGRWRVINGRKRLLALHKAKATIPTVMVILGRGSSAGRHQSLDTAVDAHRMRRAGDYVSMLNPTAPRVIAAALQYIWAWRDGAWKRGLATTRQMLDVWHRLPGIHGSYEKISKEYHDIKGPRPILVAWHTMLSSIDANAAEEFFKGVHDFSGLAARDPRRVLAIRLAGIADGEATVSKQTLHALIAKAWNAWRRGERLSSLRMVQNEAMPTIEGWRGLPDVGASGAKSRELDRLFDVEQALAVKDVTASIVTVTSEGAKNLLTINTWNRKPSMATVRRYMRDMRAERWLFSGSSIVISDKGRLLDGQQRLMALRMVGEPQDFVLVRGVNEAAFGSIDSAGTRGFAKILDGMGMPRARALAGAVVFLWRIESGAYHGGDIPSPAELLEIFERHRAGMKLAVERRGGDTLTGLTPSVSTILDYITFTESPSLAPAFWAKLNGIGDFKEGDPVLALRRKLERNRSGSEVGKAPPRDLLLWAMTAWRAYLKGETIRSLRPLGVEDAFKGFRKAIMARPKGA